MSGGISFLNGTTYSSGTITSFISVGSGETFVNLGTIISYPGMTTDAVSVNDGGVFINRGIVSATSDGITASEAGLIGNSGSVYGASAGIDAAQSNLYNAGIISSPSLGVVNALLTTNAGTITGGLDGVYIGERGQTLHGVENSGSIYGGVAGVYGVWLNGQASILDLTNSGTISGATYAVLDKSSGFTLTVLPGAVFDGAVVDTLRDGTLVLGGTAAATLDVSDFFGLATIETLAGSDWTLKGSIGGVGTTVSVIDTTVTALVTPGIGAYADAVTITNRGAVIQTAALTPAIYVQPGASGAEVVNNGIVSSKDGDGIEMSAPGSVTNNGTIIGSTGIGLSRYGSVNNTGSIHGTGVGISLAQGTVTNSGTIYGILFGVSEVDGAYLRNTGMISTNTAPTPIRDTGAYLISLSTLDNAGGTISGYFYGVSAAYHSRITNSGTVSGGFSGVELLSGASVTNSGFIHGGEIGISSDGTAAGGITNLGSIEGGTYGILAGSETSIFNSGLVQGVSRAGMDIFGGAALVNAGGTITGAAAGIYESSGDAGTAAITIANSGTIAGGSFAIDVSSALDLTVSAGAAFIGQVADTGDDGTLQLASAAGSLDIADFSGFDAITFAPGASWALEGGLAQLAGGQTISGFAAGDTITLDGFAATGASYVSGVGLVLSNAAASATLHLANSVEQFSIGNAGGATDITPIPVSVISTYEYTGYTAIVPGNGTYASSLTITNTGTLKATTIVPSGAAVSTYSDGAVTLTNNGTIDGSVSFRNGTVVNTGAIDYDIDLGSGLVVDSGTIYSPAFTAPDAISAQNSLTVVIEPGAAVDGAILDKAGDGTLVLESQYAGFGISRYGALLSGIDMFSFTNTGSQTFIIPFQDAATAGVTLASFEPGDTLEIDGLRAATDSFVSGTGLVVNGTAYDGGSFNTTIAMDGTLSRFDLTTLSGAGLFGAIDITAPCFCRATRINTARGNVAVEDLRIGDLVHTATNGMRPIRWIGRRAYDGPALRGNHLALPVKIRRHALGFNIPSRDLYVSPDHSLYEGGVLVFAWRLINGVSITQAQDIERAEYFHIELDTHDIIFAENTPAETFLDAACRARFEIAQGTPGSAAQACRPRVEDGYYLERIKDRINTRAGLRPAAKSQGPVRGNLDEITPRLQGWAQDESSPEQPVELEMLCNGKTITRFLANRYRPDLRWAGLGSGCHAFDIPRPAGQNVKLRRAGTEEWLF